MAWPFLKDSSDPNLPETSEKCKKHLARFHPANYSSHCMAITMLQPWAALFAHNIIGNSIVFEPQRPLMFSLCFFCLKVFLTLASGVRIKNLCDLLCMFSAPAKPDRPTVVETGKHVVSLKYNYGIGGGWTHQFKVLYRKQGKKYYYNLHGFHIYTLECRCNI